ncbi:MAG: ATP-dependent RNA helicase HrpA [Neisseriaceae bacterium]|nr:MAG: ATP-dependent RNA helicase HrpA [Neisseriaceae bacterium]
MGLYFYKVIRLMDENNKSLVDRIKNLGLTFTEYWSIQLERNKSNQSKYNFWVNKITQQITSYEKRVKLLDDLQISYPDNLPVSNDVNNLKKLIQDNQVLIVCGETGSGKTTQLPKILLDMDYAKRGLIGHTQPRRIAARSLANRISSEVGDNAQQVVAYKMRFNDKTSDTTSLKLMTDGVLLQEIQSDKLLLQYSALIIDEVHERSLNIDFILGYLKSILAKRPDLKIIITSATIENNKLAEFFPNSIIHNVEGKTYPVDVIYQPYSEDEDDVSLNQAIYQAITAALEVEAGNGLVFLPGEKEIKSCLNYLRKTNLKTYEILPLFSRQNAEEQAKVFAQNGRLKIILSTNVAETSLTIPGVKFVIDTGLARVKRYSLRNRVEQLNIEAISQASSKQRMGRAGRVSNGLCVRLFSETEFKTRREFTEPELLRSNLANVVLKLLSFKLGDAREFQFLDMPDNKAYNEGFRTLFQVGAIDERNQLTQEGLLLARIPIDVQLAKILLSATKFGALKEALIVVSFLAIQDPREMIIEHQNLIRERHKIWYDETSEFTQILKLWQWYHEQIKHKKSNKQLIELCHYHFLSVIRMREWHEMHRQLKEVMLGLKFNENQLEADYNSIHKAILSGFVLNVGVKDIVENYYRSTNGRKFYLHPSLNLKLKSQWIMSTNLVETTRLFARFCAEIKPEWLSEVAKHLFKYTYDGVTWSAKRGQVVATKHALLFGLEIEQAKVSYANIDKVESRQIMLRDGLVANNLTRNIGFITYNLNVIREIEKIEDKLRTSFAIIDDELFSFYDEVIPHDVFDLASLENFIKTHGDIQFRLNKDEFIAKLTNDVSHSELYPESIINNGIKLSVKYIFDHDSPIDGMNVRVNLPDLLMLNVEAFEWLVPGLIRDKINYLIKSLPKATRLMFNPLQESISKFLEESDQSKPIANEFYQFALKQKIQLDLVKLSEIIYPSYLNCHFQIISDKKVIDSGDNLVEIRQKLNNKIDNLMLKSATTEKRIICDYTIELANLFEPINVNQLRGYNSLIINKEKQIELSIAADINKARINTTKGLIALFRLKLADQIKYVRAKKSNEFNIAAMTFRNDYTQEELLNAYEKVIVNNSILVNLPSDLKFESKEIFEAALNNIRISVSENNLEFSRVFTLIAKLYKQIKQLISGHVLEEQIIEHLEWLIYPKFLESTKLEFLYQYPRYLQAIILRINKYSANSSRDTQYSDEIESVFSLWYDYCEELECKNKIVSAEMKDFYYKIEELRISLFAQELKTLYHVSSKRLIKDLELLYKQSLLG